MTEKINPKEDLRLARGMVIGRVLSARTIDGCERARALIAEWVAVFPDDEEMQSYGSFVARMESAIRFASDEKVTFGMKQ